MCKKPTEVWILEKHYCCSESETIGVYLEVESAMAELPDEDWSFDGGTYAYSEDHPDADDHTYWYYAERHEVKP